MSNVRLFFTCWLIYGVHWAPFMIREQFPAITLATHGTLNVARFVDWSPDIFRRPDGRAFINNNPGASLVGAVPLLIMRPALDAVERWNDRSPSDAARHAPQQIAESAAVRERRDWYILAVAFLTVVGAMAPISALSVTALARGLRAGGAPQNVAILSAVVFGFATPVFLRTGYLNHNLLVCHAGVFAALLLWDPQGAKIRTNRAALAGAVSGFAVLCDYSGLLVAGAAGLYVWLRAGDHSGTLRERLRAVAPFAAGAAPPVLALAAYQWWAFGQPALPSQHFMPGIEATVHGYRGMDWPSWDIALMNFFDPRFGLFAVCPLLALGLIAPFVRRDRLRVPDREMWMILGFFAAFTVFCAANRYSTLQWSTGIRYLVPTIPGLTLLSIQVLERAPSSIRRLVIIASLIFAWLSAVTHQPLSLLFIDRGAFQLSWIRRLADYGAVSHPVRWTIVVLLATSAAIAFIWWPDRRERGAPATIGGVARSE